MRIGIDARFISHPQRGGFKTYIQSLVDALSAFDHSNEYILYLDRKLSDGVGVPTRPNFRSRVLPGTPPLVGMIWREQMMLALAAAQDRLDVLHAPSLSGPLWGATPLVVTIHDMIWRSREQFAADRRRSALRLLINTYLYLVPAMCARRAKAVITVSQDARQSILSHGLVSERRLFVTPEAAGPEYHRRPADEIEQILPIRFGLKPGYLLAIGSADPRKNLILAVEAYAQLPAALRARHPFVIVWTHTALAATLSTRIAELGIARNVAVLQGVSNTDLRALYNAAALFLFPSRHEGFGLPLLEAMACGAPVVAADNSSIPEIVGDAGMLLPTDLAPAWTETIARLLDDPEKRRALTELGLQRARLFSWDRCAAETLAVYRRAADG